MQTLAVCLTNPLTFGIASAVAVAPVVVNGLAAVCRYSQNGRLIAVADGLARFCNSKAGRTMAFVAGFVATTSSFYIPTGMVLNYVRIGIAFIDIHHASFFSTQICSLLQIAALVGVVFGSSLGLPAGVTLAVVIHCLSGFYYYVLSGFLDDNAPYNHQSLSNILVGIFQGMGAVAAPQVALGICALSLLPLVSHVTLRLCQQSGNERLTSLADKISRWVNRGNINFAQITWWGIAWTLFNLNEAQQPLVALAIAVVTCAIRIFLTHFYPQGSSVLINGLPGIRCRSYAEGRKDVLTIRALNEHVPLEPHPFERIAQWFQNRPKVERISIDRYPSLSRTLVQNWPRSFPVRPLMDPAQGYELVEGIRLRRPEGSWPVDEKGWVLECRGRDLQAQETLTLLKDCLGRCAPLVPQVSFQNGQLIDAALIAQWRDDLPLSLFLGEQASAEIEGQYELLRNGASWTLVLKNWEGTTVADVKNAPTAYRCPFVSHVVGISMPAPTLEDPNKRVFLPSIPVALIQDWPDDLDLSRLAATLSITLSRSAGQEAISIHPLLFQASHTLRALVYPYIGIQRNQDQTFNHFIDTDALPRETQPFNLVNADLYEAVTMANLYLRSPETFIITRANIHRVEAVAQYLSWPDLQARCAAFRHQHMRVRTFKQMVRHQARLLFA